MTHDEAALLMHAYVDGELDPAQCLALEAHLAENPAARAACERLRELSGAIRNQAEYYHAPDALAAQLRESLPALPEAARSRPRWRAWLGQAAALAAVALVTWVAAVAYLRPGDEERIAQEVIASHVRATLANHPWDVASSDQHTVKPWLSARLSFSPPVADLSAHGYELRGARLDYLSGQPVAVLVYQRRLHSIEVYVRPARDGAAERALTRDGFNLLSFARDDMDIWLISDLNRNELNDFARLLAMTP